MNHMPLRALAGVAKVRRPTQRALAKLRTREKILASAKALFAQKGYEGATIRDIAADAGMSTGAVFASFTDKSDLFGEIITADRDAQFETMAAAAQGGTVDQALRALFEAGYRHHLADLPLLQATIAASWSPQLGAQMCARLSRRPVTDVVAGVLGSAIERGELRPDADIPLLSQMLWEGYLASFRHAAFDAWDATALSAHLDRQIGVILASSRTG